MEYTPNRFIILKLTTKDGDLYKVLAGWNGSYTEGQSWRVNSGITKVSTEGKYYLFEGYSNSIYKCNKDSYGCNFAMQDILNQIKTMYKDKVEVLPEQDFTKLPLNKE